MADAASGPAPRRTVLWRGAAAGLALLVVFVVLMDAREARRLLRDGDWTYVVPAFLATAASYLFLSAGYARVNRIFGIDLPRRELLEVGFVSFALNNLVSMGGVAGYTVRLLLLRRRGVSAANVLGASLLHSYLNQLVMFLLLPAGLVHILLDHSIGRTQAAAVGAGAALSVAAVAVATLFLVHDGARRLMACAATAIVRRVLGREVGPALTDLERRLGEAVARIRHRPAALGSTMALVLLDWAASLVALACCFRAFAEPVHAGVLITGFSVGVMAGLASMVPGGLGVQDGSMVGTYALLGVRLEHAVLASILFRLVYYVGPFAGSLLLYARIVRRTPGAGHPGAL